MAAAQPSRANRERRESGKSGCGNGKWGPTGVKRAKTGCQDLCAVIFSLNYVININTQTFIYAHWAKLRQFY